MEQDFIKNFNAGKTQILHDWIISDTDTPVSVYLKLTEKEDYAFLLESVEGGEQLGRYTIIGYDPDIIWKCEDYRTHETNPLDDLRSLIKQSHIDEWDHTLPPMATSGLFGYLGYDMIRVVEKVPDNNPDPLDIADSIFIRPRILVIFDNVMHKICVVTPVYAHINNSDIPADKVLADAMARLEAVKEKIFSPLLADKHKSKFTTLPDLTPNMSKDKFFDMVEKSKEYIRAGDIFQVVPSQRWSADFDLPPFELYRTLRRLNPSPFLFFMKYPDFALVGSSPEILVRVRNGKVTIRPIAGTRPRGKTPEEDSSQKDSLLSDAKECAEHLMLLDLGRNDVGKVSEIGSVNVTEQFVIEYYSHVMHIVSNVEGDLRKDTDPLEALMSGSPAGTVSGAPKIRAMEIIDELEPTKRKFYGSGIGYLAANGNIDSCIGLRTCLVKNGKLHVQAGGGVVADSNPEYEFQETVHKSKAILQAAEEAIAASHKN